MKAIILEPDNDEATMRIENVPIPVPGPGEILLRVHVATVNFADILLREGRYSLSKEPPVIPGLDAVGTVVKLGTGVSGLSIGDRVAAFCGGGAYAEYVTAAAGLCWLLPEEISDGEGAAVPTVGVTSYNLLTLAGRLQAGNSVMVHSAAGSVGSTCVQLARSLGAGTIIATVGSDDKKDIVSRLGCDNVINYRVEDHLSHAVKQILPGGVDVILDSVGGGMLHSDLQCLADFGRLVIFGHTSREEALIPATLLNPGNKALIGYSTTGYSRSRPEVLWAAGRAVLAALVNGTLQFLLEETYPLEDAREAHRVIESRRNIGKLLLRP